MNKLILAILPLSFSLQVFAAKGVPVEEIIAYAAICTKADRELNYGTYYDYEKALDMADKIEKEDAGEKCEVQTIYPDKKDDTDESEMEDLEPIPEGKENQEEVTDNEASSEETASE